jgi:hypothetical protein
MNKQWEKEPWRIEHADDAKITFTIALHGKHAWEMLLEDSHRYHSISHGWATDNPHDWEDAIAPVLRRLFVKGRLGFATTVPMYDAPLCSSETRAVVTINGGQNRIEPYPFFKRSQCSDSGFTPESGHS